MPSRLLAIALVLSALILAGCGSSSPSKPETTTASGLQSKSAAEILSATSAALTKVTSYHVAGTGTDKDGPSTLTGDFMANGDISVKLDTEGKIAEIISAGGSTYIRGNHAYWGDEVGSASAPRSSCSPING